MQHDGFHRRQFLKRGATATLLALLGERGLPAVTPLARSAPPADGSIGPAWLEAREVVRSGALGPLTWAQGHYSPAGPAGERTSDRWAHQLHPLLLAMDVEDLPSRVVAVGHEAPTLLIEFPSGALVYLAPATCATHLTSGVIRSRTARLSVGEDGLRLRPDGPRGVERRLASGASRAETPPICSADRARRVQSIVALAEASRRQQLDDRRRS